jgi:hypothetical protein
MPSDSYPAFILGSEETSWRGQARRGYACRLRFSRRRIGIRWTGLIGGCRNNVGNVSLFTEDFQ